MIDTEDLASFKQIIENKLLERLSQKIEAQKELVMMQLVEYRVGVRKIGRTKLVLLRVRKGKIQRRKKFSAVKGYTIRKGRLMKMSVKEKIDRRRGARRGKLKRRSKLSQSLRKRRISNRKRHALGLR